jgi:sugar phosphate isomerase/epimerase
MKQRINTSMPTPSPCHLVTLSPCHPCEIGVMVNNLERNRLKAFAVAAERGFRYIHTNALWESWLTGPERAAYVAAARASGLTIGTMFVGFDGQSYVDFPTIARTVGLVNPASRVHRCQVACAYSNLAHELGVPSLAMHLGFIPEDSNHPEYAPLIEAVRGILTHCSQYGQTLHLETGQESAAILLRFIHDVDRPNLGVNFDPANFLLYGTDEPLAALEQLAPYVWGVHCKDGRRSKQAGVLGSEVPIGQGEVNFPAFLQKLAGIGYVGPLVIEREHGPNVIQDVEAARVYLQSLAAKLSF